MDSQKTFLTAEWRYLAMLNYEVDAGLLLPFVPNGTEIDRWQGKVFVSLVGFRFLKTRILRLPIPFHSNFDEVNLRFYVRREHAGEVRRGVVFVSEIVPRRAIAFVARTVYNENYVALPMAHEIHASSDGGLTAEYRWRSSSWNAIRIAAQGEPALALDGSEEQFITEHYWGYAAQSDGGCVEYRVEHPAWRVWSAREAEFAGDVEGLYGKAMASVLRGAPASAFLAEGSAVAVMRGRRLG
ncbi:MAG TPA: DUF2071 domain-containing protein [Terriglobales bacterium]|nr:DUF2071 domain-containing protein [Terriglobales bacterium]